MTCCQIIVQKLLANKGIKDGGVKKLVLDLGNKTKYIVHYKNL